LCIGRNKNQIPENLFFHDNLITEYEIGSEYLSFYESFQKRYSYQKLATLRVRNKENEVMDMNNDINEKIDDGQSFK
jgi:hypothetical protein